LDVLNICYGHKTGRLDQSRIKLSEARFKNKLAGPSKPNLRREISNDL